MRRNTAKEKVGVALFPFLAVLICTMGALIVLLVLLVQQARVEAGTIAARRNQPAEKDDAELRQQLEDAQWRREQLEQSRGAQSQELADARARLSHLEEHLQQLQAQAQQLLSKAQAIDDGRKLRDEDLAAIQAELARLQAEVERKKSEIEDARRTNSPHQQWYALIPYVGPNGTRRRPIYVECTDRGVVIQPEGLTLGADDFAGPPGPGNPLDAALRTISEHIRQTAGSQVGDPYPLLVVRPSGVLAYAAARGALAAWDDEFGYELVGSDKRIDFGTPDPALSGKLKKSVTAARQRQTALASMMPRRYHDEEPAKSFAEDPQPVGATSERGSRRGRGIGDGAKASAGASISDSGGAESAKTNAASGASLGIAGGAKGGDDWKSAGSAKGDALAATGPAATGAPAARGTSATSPLNPHGDSSPGPSLQVGSPSTSTQAQAKSKKGSSTAGAARGNNWGLPGARGRTTAVTRPIRVALHSDRVIILPEKGEQRLPQEISIGPVWTTTDADRLAAVVQREINGWGLAVTDGYWKPVLQFDVRPGADPHFDQLRRTMEGSGFEIERKKP